MTPFRVPLFVIIPVSVVLVISLVVSGYFAWHAYEFKQSRLDPDRAAKLQAERIVSRVSRLMDMPSTERASVAVLGARSDEQYRDFFSQAIPGDAVIIFPQARRAILYRDSIDRIIDIVTLASAERVSPPSGAQEKSVVRYPLRMAILNGGAPAGSEQLAGEIIQDAIAGLIPEYAGAAKANNYTRTIVINLSGVPETVLEDVARAIGGTITTLPSYETAPDTDFLVILGADFSMASR
ncbi:MAG: hypothetical protein N2691_05660 [Patescibacteria group bacterium]|nr:hypothetical protein [Patescibacteria group bacterium]